MATYLLTWNPKRWQWEGLRELAFQAKKGQAVNITWSCGRTKKIRKGDRIFMLRQSTEPRGVFGSGLVLSDVYEDCHFDLSRPGEQANYVDIRLDTLFDPEIDEILPRQQLKRGILAGGHWDTQMSGIEIPIDVSDKLESVWSQFVTKKKHKLDNLAETGTGYGSPEQNRKVETAAVAKVTDYYRKDGWTVNPVEILKCGYDLECIKGKVREDVEVKGVSGNEISFIITAGEVAQARSNSRFVLCVVTDALNESSRIHRYSRLVFLNSFSLSSLQYRASLKKAE